MYTLINDIPVFGVPMDNAVEQMASCKSDDVAGMALMADHHLGYGQPVGGVIAYREKISPAGVGYDIACGNKAVLTNLLYDKDQINIPEMMDTIWDKISFGVGRKNKERVEHILFDSSAWEIKPAKGIKEKAEAQLGTIGSGNHFIDLLVDESRRIWIGVHFGSRGLGHTLASFYMKEAGKGQDNSPGLLKSDSEIGKEYIACMELAGQYAYAGRDWVCSKVAELIGAKILQEVHNHHNFAWQETINGEKLWVVRKGATPAWPGQLGFIGGSMGDDCYIVEGVESDESQVALHSTIHGAGRVMSRTQATGKSRYGKSKGDGLISREMMGEWLVRRGVELRGSDVDEAPQAYKRLDEVIKFHDKTLNIKHTLRPVGVAMAGSGDFDPYKD